MGFRAAYLGKQLLERKNRIIRGIESTHFCYRGILQEEDLLISCSERPYTLEIRKGAGDEKVDAVTNLHRRIGEFFDESDSEQCDRALSVINRQTYLAQIDTMKAVLDAVKVNTANASDIYKLRDIANAISIPPEDTLVGDDTAWHAIRAAASENNMLDVVCFSLSGKNPNGTPSTESFEQRRARALKNLNKIRGDGKQKILQYTSLIGLEPLKVALASLDVDYDEMLDEVGLITGKAQEIRDEIVVAKDQTDFTTIVDNIRANIRPLPLVRLTR